MMPLPRPSWSVLPWRRALLIVALVLFALLMLVGCGSETRVEADSKREVVSESHATTKEVTRHTPLENGGFVVEKVITTDTTGGERSATTSRESTKTAPDVSTTALANGLGNIAGAVMNKASGGMVPEGTGTLISALIAAAVTAYGGMKHGQAKQLREERDFHKADADEGWHRAPAPSPAGDRRMDGGA